MTDSDHARHPLEDDDFLVEQVESEPSAGDAAYRPLLKPSIVLLSAGFVVAFLAGVAASNAPPNSSLELAGSFMNRLGVFVMLVAFSMILLAYRIPHLRKLSLGVSNLRWFESGFSSLLLFNLFLLISMWCLLFLGSAWPGPGNALLASGFGIAYIALMVTILIWQDGFMRAYAVGAVTASCLIVYSGAPAMWALGPTFRGGTATTVVWPFGVLGSIVVISGVLCAGYVNLLLYTRQQRDCAPRNTESTDCSHQNTSANEREAG